MTFLPRLRSLQRLKVANYQRVIIYHNFHYNQYKINRKKIPWRWFIQFKAIDQPDHVTKFLWKFVKNNFFILQNVFTEKTVSLIKGQRKNFFELKTVLLIRKIFQWSKKIDLFALTKHFLNQQNSSIQRIFFFDVPGKLENTTENDEERLSISFECKFCKHFYR